MADEKTVPYTDVVVGQWYRMTVDVLCVADQKVAMNAGTFHQYDIPSLWAGALTEIPPPPTQLKVGETVIIKNWRTMGSVEAAVDHAYAGGVVVLRGSWPEYQPYSNLERKSGAPILVTE